MRQFQAGQGEAFDTLFARYTSPLINFTYRFLGSRDEAEDVAQEVFVRIYRSKERYDPARPFRAWIFTIAARLAADHTRKRKRHAETSLDRSVSTEEDIPLSAVLPDSGALSPEEIQTKKEVSRTVQAALAGLPNQQRTAVLLCRFEQMAYEDIAKTMGLSASSVKSLLFRARQTLAKILIPYHELQAKQIKI